MRFAGLHSHLLPGVDDGSGSLEEILRELRGELPVEPLPLPVAA